MSKEEIPSREASCTLRASKWLFFGVRAFVPFQMLKTSKGPSACSTNMRSRLVRLGWREVRVYILGTV